MPRRLVRCQGTSRKDAARRQQGRRDLSFASLSRCVRYAVEPAERRVSAGRLPAPRDMKQCLTPPAVATFSVGHDITPFPLRQPIPAGSKRYSAGKGRPTCGRSAAAAQLKGRADRSFLGAQPDQTDMGA